MAYQTLYAWLIAQWDMGRIDQHPRPMAYTETQTLVKGRHTLLSRLIAASSKLHIEPYMTVRQGNAHDARQAYQSCTQRSRNVAAHGISCCQRHLVQLALFDIHCKETTQTAGRAGRQPWQCHTHVTCKTCNSAKQELLLEQVEPPAM